MIHKVLLISPLPPPSGGIAALTKMMLNNGIPGGYDLVVVNTSTHLSRGHFRAQRNLYSELKRSFVILKNLIKVLRADAKISVVHLNSSAANLGGLWRDLLCVCIARLYKKPILIQYHGDLICKYQNCLGLHGFLLRRVSNFCNMAVVLNNRTYQFLKQKRAVRNLKELPNFLDNFWMSEPKERPARQSGVFKIIFVGDVCVAKGVADILELAKRSLDLDIEIQLVGRVVEEMFSVLASAPPNVRCLGLLDPDQVKHHLDESDIFLFLSHQEAFPVSVLEAMARGLPVLATSVGGVPQMIDEGKGGWIYDIGDIGAVERGLRHLLMEPSLCRSMGQYNQEKVRNRYCYDVVTGSLVELYSEICASVTLSRES